jgi:hypothetical protein
MAVNHERRLAKLEHGHSDHGLDGLTMDELQIAILDVARSVVTACPPDDLDVLKKQRTDCRD